MMTKEDFEEIRPYIGEEVSRAIERIIKHPIFFHALSHIFNDKSQEELEMLARDITTTYDFQRKVMYPGLRKILAKSSRGLSFSGFDQIQANVPHVYVANHRDIFLDSSIFQMLLVEHGLETTQITFGSNLMDGSLITDLGKINKMFTVFRGGTRREQYERAKRLSTYIRRVIVEEKESVWIAQRNGRTKDGNDQTQMGLINMLLNSDRKNFINGLDILNIIPVAISYEYEPCDYLKIQELYQTIEKPYVKQPGEDLQSILSGVNDYKGRIHLSIGQPLSRELLEEIYDQYDKADRYQQVASYIDREIYQHYRLWPTNYIAVDLMGGKTEYQAYYSAEDLSAFQAHIDRCLLKMEGNKKIMRKMLLEMYAYPVFNWLKVEG